MASGDLEAVVLYGLRDNGLDLIRFVALLDVSSFLTP